MRKRVQKRLSAGLLAILMLFLTVFTSLGDVTIAKAEGVTIKLYYEREDASYDDWSVWFWPKGGDGEDVAFEEEDGKMVATFTGTNGASEVGFIVRTQDWTKDVDKDQFIDIEAVVSGTVDVYVTSGVEGYEMEYEDDVVTGTKVKTAKYNSDSTITVTMTGEIEGDYASAFTITDKDENSLAVASVTYDGDYIYTVTLAEPLDDAAKYHITFDETTNKVVMPSYYSTAAFEEQYTYEGDDLGATYTPEKTSFRVWAPTAEAMKLNLYDAGNDGNLLETIDMTSDVNGTWVAEKEGDLNGTYYTYTVTVDDEESEVCDPYARTTGVNGERAMVIDLDETDPEGWDEDSNPHADDDINDAIIYEGHIRDLTIADDTGIENAGKFLGLTETGTKTSSGIATGLDHIKELGVTHLQILPMYDFASVDETYEYANLYNWGYDPQNYNVPEGSYSTDPYNGEVRVSEMKQMIQALHQNDISVVMDVVYNHVYSADEFCMNVLTPKYFSREDENGGLCSGSGCGNDTATERSMVKKYIIDSVLYWTTEYHIDGFRFDLVGLMDTELMNEIVEEVHAIRPDVIFYGEGWTLDTTVTKEGYDLSTQTNSTETPELGYFSDTIRDGLKGNVFDTSTTGYVSGSDDETDKISDCFLAISDWSSNPSQTINYASCHDNNTLIDVLSISRSDASREDQVKMNNLAAAIYLTAEGVPFMQAGEEMLRSKVDEDGNYDSNSYQSGDEVNAINYSNLEEEEYANTFAYYKGLIAFRKAHSALRLSTADQVSQYVSKVTGLDENVLAYDIQGGMEDETAEEMYVIFNPNEEETTVTLPDGNWNVYIDGEKAGTTALRSVSKKVTLDGISAMVLIREDAKVASNGGVGTIVAIVVAAVAVVVFLLVMLMSLRKKKHKNN